MSLKSQSHFISPLTGKEVSKATYYRHMKKSQSQSYDLADEWSKEVGRTSGKIIANRINKSLSQSQSQSHETFCSLDSQYDALFEVFKHLFLAASSRGIPKKIVQECERFL